MMNRARASLYQQSMTEPDDQGDDLLKRRRAAMSMSQPMPEALSAQSYFGYNRQPMMGNTVDLNNWRQPMGGGYFS